MHATSLKLMEEMRDKYLAPGTVIDVGSMDVNGSYKYLFKGYTYLGVDMEPGPNVDIVMKSQYEIPLPDESADILISGQCIEHVKNPFRLMAEAVRCIRPGGYVVCIAPHLDGIHRYPIDTFRYNPDGMEAIFEECNVDKLECFVHNPKRAGIHDCIFVGRKQ